MRHASHHVGTRDAVRGDGSISITEAAAGRRTRRAGHRFTTAACSLTGLLLALGAGIAMAAPAVAVEDLVRPDARVTHGPSCRPGGLVVEVTAGPVPWFVRLATTRMPGGEDEATVAPGTTVVLRTGDVDWGETIDGRLEFRARDDSGATFVDELDDYSFVRPTEEDCAAAQAPTQVHPPPPAPQSGAAPREDGTPQGDTATGTPAPRTQAGPPPPADPSSGPDRSRAAVPTAPDDAGTAGSASVDRVLPGQALSVHGTGFRPGEPVSVRFPGGEVLGTATAGPDGSVRAHVRIPTGTGTGSTTVTLVGDDSAAVADVDLQIAAASAPARSAPSGDDATPVVPLVTAVGALVATGAVLLRVAARPRAATRRRSANGGA